ncbi:amidohydrolase family protein [Aspergillus puulaauensis]|uniref:6-methylsalicylate decarboxylase n=1 Tax=Aspergillus puulaauensis TaxID=1220207 RepID=A0A7R7XMY9_9EURO|nr:uncharacterized protein APUU_40367A [Aspergillus puulaauensis]BCS23923.1 hypothetical protein APUU_40367A [Aspergillus puulaauensis]
MTAGYSKPDGMPGIPAWSEEDHLKLMAQANITKSILSISSPGTYLVPGDDHQARFLSRECNKFAADLKRRHPDRFGFWAALPLPDVEGSLLELAYALDHLNADGVAVFTNSRGTYLGDESLDPVFQELNRRNATVFVHPTSPCMPDGQSPAAPLTRYPNPMFEFFFDSARAVINLFLSETTANFTDITYIISHAGGALPPTIERFTSFASSILGLPFEINSDVVKEAFARQFYFDLAGFAFPDQVYGLLRYVDASRIVYGSDYPYTPASGVLSIANTINENIGEAFPRRKDRQAIFTGNAQRILARAG